MATDTINHQYIGSRLVASMSLELFVRGLYTRTAVTRHPCFSWAFLLPVQCYA